MRNIGIHAARRGSCGQPGARTKDGKDHQRLETGRTIFRGTSRRFADLHEFIVLAIF